MNSMGFPHRPWFPARRRLSRRQAAGAHFSHVCRYEWAGIKTDSIPLRLRLVGFAARKTVPALDHPILMRLIR
jgi:hypothetical protein